MPVTTKELKLMRAKQQRMQNTRHAITDTINELGVNYNLVVPQISDYVILCEWIKEQHSKLAGIKTEREQLIKNNNCQIEKLNEQYRVNITQALQDIDKQRISRYQQYTIDLQKEQQIFDVENERIKEKHIYLVSSNMELLQETREQLKKINNELVDLNLQMENINKKITDHKSRNDKQRQQVLDMLKIRKQIKQDKQNTLQQLNNTIIKEETIIRELETKIESYKDRRRVINADYYIWKDELEAILKVINTANNDTIIHKNKIEKQKLETEDIRRLPDTRYKELDLERDKWTKDMIAHKRQLSRLKMEVTRAEAICPEHVTIDRFNTLTPEELEKETELNNEYQLLKTQKLNVNNAIQNITVRYNELVAKEKHALETLEEESNGLGNILQEQLNRAQHRLDTMTNRLKTYLDSDLRDLTNKYDMIQKMGENIENEKNELLSINMKLDNGDINCKLNNDQICRALTCLDRLHKLVV